MRDFKALINEWPTLAAFARDVGVNYETARKMRSRNIIKPEHWTDVLRAARERKIKVTVETLLRMSRRRSRNTKDARAAA